MRHVYLLGLLAVAGCGSNHTQVIKDVCVPINEEGGPKLEDLAKAKGYDVEETKTVCRQYLKDEMKRFADGLRASGMSKDPSPFDASR
jgi:hypothetical protein